MVEPTTTSEEPNDPQLALLLRAQRAAWQQKQPLTVEELLARQTGPVDVEFKLALIIQEQRLRNEQGEVVEPGEYQRRYPELAERLAPVTTPDSADTGDPYLTSADRSEPMRVSPLAAHAVAVPGYEVLGELGRGGMGVVYKARHLHLKRLVALKMILSGAHAGAQELARFRLEAEAVARLQHANIVQVYDVGEHEGRPYLALEFIDGGSLAAQLQGSPQPPREAARVVEQLARAMHEAHQRQIVHRDLKPANVLMQKQPDGPGIPKITDFGLAKQLDDDSGQTHSGAIMGTPSYMAPEQAAGRSKEIGPAADIHALGAILYEMLTGRPPFKGAAIVDTLDQVRHRDPVAPTQLQVRLPRDLETICLLCLRKEPQRRYATALALAEDLTRFLRGEPIQARPVSNSERFAKWCRRHPAIATLSAAVILTTLTGLALVTWKWREAEAARVAETNARKQEELQRKQTEAALRTARANLYFNHLALIEREWAAGQCGQVDQLLNDCPLEMRSWEWHYLKRRNNSAQLAFLADERGVNCLAFAPGQQWLASGGGDLFEINAAAAVKLWKRDGTPLFTLDGHKGAVTALSFSPDGKWLASASTRTNPLRVIKGDIEALNRPEGEVIVWDLVKRMPVQTFKDCQGSVAFSPDGKHLAAAHRTRRLSIWSVAEQGEWPLVREFEPFPGETTNVRWSADSKRLAAVDTVLHSLMQGKPQLSIELALWDAETGKLVRSWPGRTAVAQLALGARLLACAEADGSIYLHHLEGKEAPIVLKGHANAALGLAFAPDQQRLVSCGRDRLIKTWNLATGQEISTISGHADAVTTVVFLEDQLASACKDGSVCLWPADRGQGPLTLSGHAAAISQVAVSPDGLRVASREVGGIVRIFDVTGKMLHTLDAQAEKMAFSPDGKRLATVGGDAKNPDLPGDVSIWDVASGERGQRLTGHTRFVLSVSFSPDGRYLVTCSGNPAAQPARAGEVNLWDARTGVAVTAFRPPDVGFVSLVCFSADSRLIALACGDRSVRLCQVESGAEIACLEGHEGWLTCLAAGPDGAFASGDGDGFVHIWHSEPPGLKQRLRAHDGAVFGLTFSADGRRLASASFDMKVSQRGDVKIWDVERARACLTLPGQFSVDFGGAGRWLAAVGAGTILEPGTVKLWDGQASPELFKLHSPSAVRGLALGPGNLAATGHNDHAVRLWDLAEGRELATLRKHQEQVLAVTFSPDGTRLASGGLDSMLRLWDPASKKLLGEAKNDKPIVNLCFNPSGSLLAAACTDGVVSLRAADTLALQRTLRAEEGTLFALAFKTNDVLAVGGRDRRLRWWNLANGANYETWEPAKAAIGCCAFSPDGQSLAVSYGADEARAIVWDMAKQAERFALMGHKGAVPCVVYSPDGRWLATGGADRSVRLWHADTGQLLHIFQGHLDQVTRVVFTANGARLISGSLDRTIRVWDVTGVVRR